MFGLAVAGLQDGPHQVAVHVGREKNGRWVEKQTVVGWLVNRAENLFIALVWVPLCKSVHT